MQLQHDRKISPAGGEFVLCLLHASGIYCLTKNPLDVVISKRFTAAACEVGGQEGEAGTSEAGMFLSSTGPCGVCRDAGAGHCTVVGGHRRVLQTSDLCRGWTCQCQVHAALSWTKALCVRVLASLMREGPVPLGSLSGSLNPCPMSALAITSLFH